MQLTTKIKQIVVRIRWGMMLAPILSYCGAVAMSFSFHWEDLMICIFVWFGLETASVLSGRKFDNMIITLTMWVIGVIILYSVLDDLKKSAIISIGFLCFQTSIYFLPERVQNRIKKLPGLFKETTKGVAKEIDNRITDEGERNKPK